MIKFFKKYFWTILIIFSAVGLAGSAAYFSISGLSKLFAGSSSQVIIMAAFLEFAKIATTAALHRFWKGISWGLKIPLTLMVIIIMIITSSGIYGFLANAYSSTSNRLEKMQGEITLIEKQQEQKKEKILGIEELKTSKSNRMNSLIELRGQQESRLDSLYNRGWSSSAKNTQKLIDQSTVEIQSLQVEIDTLVTRIQRVNNEIGELDIKILELQNTDVATEIGPLKYMSTVLKTPMENVINWFIMAIMLAFDPLAVLLVILANVVYDRTNENYRGNAPPLEGKKGLFSKIKEKFKKKTEPSINLEEPIVESEVEEIKEESIDKDEEYKNIIEAVNNTNQDILSYSYEFSPGDEKKLDDVVEYIEGKDGSFKKSDDSKKSLASIIQGIDSNPVYLQLLDVFFMYGKRKSGDTIPKYEIFLNEIKDKGIECEERVVKNFLTIANLLGIVNMLDNKKVTLIKDYESSKQIISLVSK
ncbi:MAG: hypothetical protein AABY15_05615 [Nanoarchaeota archaeon]